MRLGGSVVELSGTASCARQNLLFTGATLHPRWLHRHKVQAPITLPAATHAGPPVPHGFKCARNGGQYHAFQLGNVSSGESPAMQEIYTAQMPSSTCNVTVLSGVYMKPHMPLEA